MFSGHLSRQHFGPRLGFNTPISGLRVLNSVVYRGSLRCHEAAADSSPQDKSPAELKWSVRTFDG